MSCFGGNVSPDLFQNCCNANQLCEWNGNLEDVVSEPIYVQKVYDAVLFNLQGLKTVSNQCFSPAIPKGHRLKRVIDVRCKRFFNPLNVDDPNNLTLDLDTTISGATFIKKCDGEEISVVGPDGTFSEKVLFADTDDCDEKCMGTPIFGTQNIHVTGDVLVTIDLLLCDRCDHEVVFTVSANVNIANSNAPLMLTNFFEMCMPSTHDSAFLPRFTEFCNPACETRLATNNIGRDITVCPDGTVKANLIIALCVTCEKKIIVPVQLCVLSTGFVQLAPQVSTICTTFPSLFPNQIKESDTIENCGETESEEESTQNDCQCECECECECVDPCNNRCNNNRYNNCDPCRPRTRR
ncbi:hypothetical protein [Anaerovorax odorimutans]|uniref:hypothetical protein n=1 Tax=Anaerovorax odorimutans TaxID=109327 RepID=UPI0004132C37|nr:hypothetical protein [Anaerovorax odorimutans]